MEAISTTGQPFNEEFHIGFTMAGAASAGCYTAGVMDYFFEMMDLWEKAKDRKLPAEWGEAIYEFVPKHKVILDVMGGTSAGGMTTMMAAIYAMNGVINPVRSTENKNQKKNNILYDAWVLMGDTPAAGTNDTKQNKKLFEKIFDTDDLEKDKKITALLNSGFIDSICSDAFHQLGAAKKLPAYISPDLEILLSHTMLRGMPLSVDFTSTFGHLRPGPRNPEHFTFDHFTVSHFKINYDPVADKDHFLSMDPGSADFNKNLLELVTKATGAFPLGLRYREFDKNAFTPDYLKNVAKRNIFKKQALVPPAGVPLIKWPDKFPDPFDFISVDGGAVNNEPFGEVLQVLKRKHPDAQPDQPDKFALIMIDPFPDVYSERDYPQPADLFAVAPGIVGTLWDQSKVKRAEMLDIYEGKYNLTEIYPVRYPADAKGNDVKSEKNAIACGAAMAFSGFLDIDFRHHDFFLGRNNARNFFRAYFSYAFDETADIMHPLHRSWTPGMRQQFKFQREGKTFLPIVPDMEWLHRKLSKTTISPFKHDVEWPKYDPAQLFAVSGAIEKRIKKLLEMSVAKMGSDKKASSGSSKTEALMKGNYKSNIFKKLPVVW